MEFRAIQNASVPFSGRHRNHENYYRANENCDAHGAKGTRCHSFVEFWVRSPHVAF